MKRIILAASTALFCFQTWAQDSLNTRIHNFYRSPRAMGMGNAFTAIADDYAGMFYNPSMLVYRKNSEFQINIISAALATDTMALASDMQDASDAAKAAGGDDNDEAVAISNVLEKYYGSPLGVRLSPLEFVWVSPNWGLGIVLADVSADIMIQRQVGPALDVSLLKDTSINYSYAMFLDEESSVGILGKFIHRNEFIGQYSALDLALDSKIVDFKNSKEGMNVDFDLAYTWKPVFQKTVKKTEKIETKTETKESAKLKKIAAHKRMIAQEAEATMNVGPAPEVKTDATVKPETEVKTDAAVAEKKEGEKTEIDKAAEGAADKTAEKPADKATDKPTDVVKDAAPADPKTPIDTKTDGVQIHTKKIDESEEEIVRTQPLAVSAVLRNVISMAYSKSTMVNKDATDKPLNNIRVLDVGASYAIFDADYSKLTVAAEAKNLMHPQATITKCAHLGVEYSLGWDWLKMQLRAGMSQMYFTAGLGLNLGPLDLEFATFGEEFGTDDAKTENRVTAATIALKF